MDNEILAKYLCGEASPAETEAVERWINDSPRNRMEVERLKKSISFVVPRYRENSLNADIAWKKLNLGVKSGKKILFRRYWLQIASVLIIIVSIGSIYFVHRDTSEWVAVSTLPDQTKAVFLPDSTQITLSGSSSIRYEANAYRKEQRVVEMKGKAFFEVKRNEARPFLVKTPVARVEVLGTTFQVKASDMETGVNVETGKVRLSGKDSQENVILTAGMSALYTKSNNEIRIISEEDVNYLSWKTGLLRFNETPLSEVINKLNEYYKVTLTGNCKTDNYKLTASFNNMPLEQVLTVINQTLDISLSTKK